MALLRKAVQSGIMSSRGAVSVHQSLMALVDAHPYLHSLVVAPFGRQLQISRVIPIVEESLLSPVATLRNMVWQAGNHDSCKSCHDMNVTEALASVNN